MRPGMNPKWPVLTRYDGDHLARIALPLGGIGTGTVSLGGRGDLRDWEIVNRPAKGFAPCFGRSLSRPPFFAVYAKPSGRQAVTRAVEGPLDLGDYEGAQGSEAPNHGLPRFRNCSFAAAYPLGQVMLSEADVPVDIRLEAFNPLIPGDADRSGIPVAVLRFVLRNKTSRRVTASVCGSMPNFIGADGSASEPRANRNRFRRTRGLQGVFMYSQGVHARAEQWGTMALATTARTGVTYRTGWRVATWGNSSLDFWDDFSGDGALDNRRSPEVAAPMASLAVKFAIRPRATRAVTFLLTWHFPNRRTWTPRTATPGRAGARVHAEDRVGNYYTTRCRDAWDAAARVAASLGALEAETVAFVRAFCRSDLPQCVKEAALFNLSTLRTQTCFRTEDGRFYGFEGCNDHTGSCLGSCTHVWNYEQATAFLFGDLARSMREVEFLHATDGKGLMSFRVSLPLKRARARGKAAADGQMGCIMKLYREWQLSGDEGMLRRLWPRARKALEFCWIAGGWDADRDGVMEGCQHNTMDVEYYGPNPQMAGWYLGALRAAEEMARHVGEKDFAARCRELFERGARTIDKRLFNGDYYEHRVEPPCDESAIADGLRIGIGAAHPARPDLQLGAGCLVDQLAGQCMAHICGLGYLLNRRNVRRTLRSILRYNTRSDFCGHFNPMRSFVLGDETGLLMATYPRGRRPRRPFPYFNEVMTGFEYTAAVHMLYEGQVTSGVKCIGNIRARYDGRKRNPFDEAECGHHYARAMASWGAVVALTGFRYSGVEKTIEFAAAKGASRAFWSNGYAWGTSTQTPRGGGVRVRVTVLGGALELKRVTLAGVGTVAFRRRRRITRGRSVTVHVPRS